jgi:hypothetical protein
MIDNLVDSTIALLLSASIPGLTAVAGMQDNDPPLKAPYCAVYSQVQATVGRVPIYELLTTIEYVSVSGLDEKADVSGAMTAIDTALNSVPPQAVIDAALAAGFVYGPAWQHVQKTNQEVGDRRRNVRELKVFAQLA